MQALKEKISSSFPFLQMEENTQYLTVKCPVAQWKEVALQLKSSFSFDYLFCVTGVDYLPTLGVVYHLENTSDHKVIVIKVEAENRENAIIPTVCDIWPTAEFHEREVFELFGIRFEGHPDLRNLLLEDDFNGHPFRKDYTDAHILDRKN